MLVVIKGAGDLATGVALRLIRAGIKVAMTDLEQPTCIRRTVSFSTAIPLGVYQVEGVTARFAKDAAEALRIIAAGEVPVLADPEGHCIPLLRPDAVVDAILAKRNLGTRMGDAPIVIALGPGFTAGVDAHAVIETKRGHMLSRALYEGSASPDTGIPGNIGGFTEERILRAPAAGVFEPLLHIGDMVEKDDAAAVVAGVPMRCRIGGVLRGLLQGGLTVHEGMKCGDVDPRGDKSYCYLASDKAMAIGGGVLEALLHFSNGTLP